MTITVKRAEGYVDFCPDLDLRAEWENATNDLQKAQGATTSMLVDPAVADAAQRVRDLEAQMSASIIVFRVTALTRVRWQELGVEHLPREGHEQDRVLGVNTATFFDAVAIEAILSVNEGTRDGKPVDFDPATEWVPLANEMSNGQYNDFVQKFLELNQGATSVPFSRLASAMTRSSTDSSDSLGASESVSSD